MCNSWLCPLDQLYGRRRLALFVVALALILLVFSAAFEHSWKHVCSPGNSNDTDVTQGFYGVYTKGGAYEGFDIRHYIQITAVVIGTATFLISATLWSESWDEHFLRLRLVVVICMTLFTGSLLMGELVLFSTRCSGADVYPRGYWLDLSSLLLFLCPSVVFFAELHYMYRAVRRTYQPISF